MIADIMDFVNKYQKMIMIAIVCYMIYYYMNIEGFKYGDGEYEVVNNKKNEVVNNKKNNEMKLPIGIKSKEEYPASYDGSYMLDDGSDGKMKITDNPCSKSCCSVQYQSSILDNDGGNIDVRDNKYVSSNIFCNTPFQDSGCLCLEKDQARFIGARGSNAN